MVERKAAMRKIGSKRYLIRSRSSIIGCQVDRDSLAIEGAAWVEWLPQLETIFCRDVGSKGGVESAYILERNCISNE
jgi:hypothetical protein